jgi:hypothetical protein
MSFRKTLSDFSNNINNSLFPRLQEQLGEMTEEHKRLLAILELVRIEEFVRSTKFKDGRPPKDRCAMARAYVAKIVLKIPYTTKLIERLKLDKHLRIICGWDCIAAVPDKSKFSRVFKEFSSYALPDKAHQALIKDIYKDKILGHVVKDSTPLEAREKAVKKDSRENRKKAKADKKKATKAGELTRRQKQLKSQDINQMMNDLPKQCDIGMKKSGQGYTMTWKGYKVHAAVDDHCIPLAVIVTSASLNDCEAAIPLASKTNQVVTNFYDLMDAAYDHPEIKEHSRSLGHVPMIDKCPSGKSQKIEKQMEKDRKKALNFKTAEDLRYHERFSKERFNAVYKDYNVVRSLFYRGYEKVSCHVMFGVLTVAATMLISLLQ